MDIVINIVAPILSAIVSWFLARGKYQTEVQTSEIENIDKAIQIWRKTAEDLNVEVIALRNESAELRRESAELRQEVQELRNELKKYQKTH